MRPPRARTWILASATFVSMIWLGTLDAPAAFSAVDPALARAASRIDEIAAEQGAQTELPGIDAATVREEEAPSPRRGRRLLPAAVGAALGQAATGVVWLVLAALVAGLLVALAVTVRRRRLPAPALEVPPSSVAATVDTGEPLEALVARDAWGEAARELLRRAIEALAADRPGGLPASATGREIQRRAVPVEHAPAFAVLLDAVERSLFGGAALARADYRRCAEAYRRLTAGDQP